MVAPGCAGPDGLPYLGASTVQVWASATNNRNAATQVGSSATGVFLHSGLATSQTRYYWIRPVDVSGQIGSYYPVSSTGGVVGTTQSEVPPAGSVGTIQIAAGAVTATQVADGAITTPKLTANCVTSATVAADAIYANAIQANAVTAGKIAAGSISADRIDANGISANQIKTGTLNANIVTVTNLNASAITAGTLTVANIVSTSNISAQSVTESWSSSGTSLNFTPIGGGTVIIMAVTSYSRTSPVNTTDYISCNLTYDGGSVLAKTLRPVCVGVSAGPVAVLALEGHLSFLYYIPGLVAGVGHTIGLNTVSTIGYSQEATFITSLLVKR